MAQDPDTLLILPLFNPRRDDWERHFIISSASGVRLGVTPVGRATAALLGFSTRFDSQIYFHQDKDLIDVSALRSDARDPLDQLYFLRAERLRCNFENVISLGMQLAYSEPVLASPNKLLFQSAAIGQVIETHFIRSRNEHELREGLALAEKWRRYFQTEFGDKFDPKPFDRYSANIRRHLNAIQPTPRTNLEWPYEPDSIPLPSNSEYKLLRALAVASTAASANQPEVIQVELPTIRQYMRSLGELRTERLKDFIVSAGHIAKLFNLVPSFFSSDETDFIVSQMNAAAMFITQHYAFDMAFVIWLQRHISHSGIAGGIVPPKNVLMRAAKRAHLYNEFRQLKYAGQIYIN
jgi:hypothetical protein